MGSQGTPTASVLVVSGFLGAGKTSLVRRVLEAAREDGIRMAVVSNEFGELGIDASLLGDTAESYVEIEGGCVCCKLGDELVATLQMLHERVRPERVVIETSGVALPDDTQIALWREPVSNWVEDDIAVVVVNAEQVLAGRDLEGTFEDQVGAADLLLLNKTDLVSEAALPGVEAQLLELAPDTAIVRCRQGDVEQTLLFPPSLAAREAAGIPPRRQSDASGGSARPHRHEAFISEVLELAAGVDPDRLREDLLRLGALRVKGFVATSRGVELVQGVGPRVEIEPTALTPPEGGVGRVVVIRRA